MVKKRLLEAGQESGNGGVPIDRLRVLIAQVLGCPAADVREESFLVADLGGCCQGVVGKVIRVT